MQKQPEEQANDRRSFDSGAEHADRILNEVVAEHGLVNDRHPDEQEEQRRNQAGNNARP